MPKLQASCVLPDTEIELRCDPINGVAAQDRGAA